MAGVRMLLVLAAVLGAALALGACGNGGGGTTTIATAPTGQTTETEATETEATSTAAKKATPPAKKAAPPAKKAAPPAKKTAAPEAAAKENAAAEQGKQVFVANGCGGCHTLAAADATGTAGPDLEETLVGKSTAYIHTAIVDPNADIAPGYSANIMPSTFGSSLSDSEVEALVVFLQQSAGK